MSVDSTRAMRRVLAALCATLAALAGVPAAADAATIRYRTDAELVAMSERVVHARVLRQRTARPDGPNGPIYTITTLAVLEDLTGRQGDMVDVWELGGAYGNEIMYVGGAVKYGVGEDVFVMLERGRHGLRSTAMGFSKFDALPIGRDDAWLARNTHDTAVLGEPARAPQRTLSQFRDLARQVRGVPSRRNRGAASLVPEYSATDRFTLLIFGNGLGPRWLEADFGTPVTWYKNTSAPVPLTSGDGANEIQTALAAWTNPSSASIVLNYGGTTNQSDADGPWTGIGNGNGVITFEDPNNEIGGSTLAIGGGFASFGNGGTVNGATFNRFTRGYVIFQNAANLSPSFRESLNFGRVMQHEIGHGIGLGHTQTDGSVTGAQSNIMYFQCCSASTPVPPALGGDDLAGVSFIYPATPTVSCSYSISPATATYSSAAATGTVAVTASAPSCGWTGSVGSASSFLSITSGASGAGSGPLTYSVAANSATSQRTGTLAIAGRTFTVTQAGTAPAMSLDKSSLQFSATTTGAAFATKTAPQGVRLTQSGTGTVTWTAVASKPWLTVTPSSGTGSATLTIGVTFASGLPLSGTDTGQVTLQFSGAGNSTASIAVTLGLRSGLSAVPFGTFETPVDGVTGVTGSLAVTGWALDDVEVTRLRIMRSAVTGESGLIYIGDAVFVDGSRPDVAGVYSALPRHTRAGWGYLLLSNFLPAGGNGTFTLHAYADDADGQATWLGSKTITCTNSSATEPFGAIDTPGQGETVSGVVNNFGWVLAPGTKRADVPGGGSVTVFIDGVAVGSPSGWSSRSDITSLFPSSGGVSNAVSVFTFDTRNYTNGVHTIAWSVRDNGGATQGVGSRFFTISNGTGVTEAGGSRTEGESAAGPAVDVDAAPLQPGAVLGRRGYDLTVPLRALRAIDRRSTLFAEEVDRVELRVAPLSTGYLRAGGTLRPLPAGSSFDSASGTFAWQPGPGFVGTYDLVFVQWNGGTAVARQEVRVLLYPKASGRVGPQVLIDLPSAERTISAGEAFTLAGWAVDLDTDIGTGVDALHVWSYPGDGGEPLWVGTATYGGHRPDVGAIFGDQFTNSGYGLQVRDLPPGRHYIAVFAWSTVQGKFVPAQVVPIAVR